MEKNQTAESLFRGYRRLAENEGETYNRLKTSFPTNEFPKHAARFWRFSVLAEAWGSIATELSSEGVDYLNEWREGQ